MHKVRVAHPEEERSDLGEQAYRLLYGEIIRCRILPGQDITEAQMCDTYGLSRSPVRRALALLAHDGLIMPIPRLGFHISDISLVSIRQTFEMRASLEGVAARACMGRVDVAALRNLNQRYVTGANAGEHGMMAVHNQMHHIIYAASNNPIMEKVLNQLLDQSNRIAYFVAKVGGKGNSGSDVTMDDHEALFEALDTGDVEAAAALSQEHVRDSEKRVIDALLSSRHFSDLPIRISRDAPSDS
ncbi:GntR family transcriptional regulator [Sphingobium subterraneum]|uniref:DNA-binding GntR family transcriptional regulator n=1 Tax=Sphingobium subterraneum TaxID=627688 RepID=A0A841J397_9SPHN|nr:GntR family transcriptional regulator [Sphingobium subterraneum]MBB6125287.1 DNA-binding GntR family transcriptional regulator [Sphingobium subterraneum]